MKSLFRVPARVHNGLLLMTYLAANYADGTPVSLDEIAVREKLSQGYLEEVANSLRQAGLIEGKRGQKGGYVLSREPKEYNIATVVDALEGPMTIVSCLSEDATCPSDQGCSNRKIWKTVQDNIADTLKTISLAELITKHYALKQTE